MGNRPAPAPGDLVGRDAELAELRAALDAAAAGSGSVRLLAGEPGIGKTRLAREVAARAEHRGFAVGWGRTWEAGGAPPFWPWTRALRDVLRCYHDEDHVASAVRNAPAVTALLPELAEVTGDAPFGSAAAAGSADERFAVFEAVSTLLSDISRHRPALLVLDDIHAADEPSLLLLQFVGSDVCTAGVLLLATFRDVEARQDEKRAARVTEIARQGSVLHLAGLSAQDTQVLVEARLPTAPTAGFIARIQEATSGNPFFVEEVIRLWRAETPKSTPIPTGVRDTVRSQLSLLPADTYSVLVNAAVLGRSFDEHVLGRILDRTAEEIVDLLRPAVEATLIVREEDELRFRHGLIREVLVDEAPAADRARIHARVVSVLESLPPLGRERHLSELAHHAVRAVSGDAEQAIVHARNAGDAAMRSLAFEEAVRHYESALDVGSLAGIPEHLALDLLVALERARAAAGDYAGARQTAREAQALATQVGSAQHLAQAALAYPSMAMAVWRVDEHHLAMLRQALDAVGADGDPATRSMLLCTLIGESYFGRTPVKHLVDEAVRLAQESGDPLALAQAQLAAHYATRSSQLSAAVLEQDRSVPLAREAGDTALEARARLWRIGRWLELGVLSRVDTELVEYEQLVERTRRPIDLWWSKVVRGMRLIHDGRYAEAERTVQDAADYGYRFAGVQALSVFGAQDYLLRMERTPWEQILAGLLALPDDFRQRLPVRSSLVRVHASLGQHERVRHELAEFAEDDYALLPRDRSRLTCLALLAEAAADVGERDRAEELLTLMERYAGTFAVAPPFAVFGPFDLHRGRLLHLLGRHDEAAQALRAALAQCERTGGRPYATRCRLHLASLLSQTGDHAAARGVLVQARDDAQELGLVLLEAAAGEALAALAPAVVQQATSSGSTVRLQREGEYWTIAGSSKVVRLRDSKGLQYLSRLIDNPGRDIHVLELAGGAPAAATAPPGDSLRAGSDDLGPVLDERAKAEYRRRIQELQQEIDDAVEQHDDERAARAREEHDVFVSELSRALGLHGRDRRSGSAAEQTRINVTKAVKAAIRRIHDQDTDLGAELEAAVRTGLFCSYLPLAGQRRWELFGRP